jgi:hypothetical protein
MTASLALLHQARCDESKGLPAYQKVHKDAACHFTPFLRNTREKFMALHRTLTRERKAARTPADIQRLDKELALCAGMAETCKTYSVYHNSFHIQVVQEALPVSGGRGHSHSACHGSMTGPPSGMPHISVAQIYNWVR